MVSLITSISAVSQENSKLIDKKQKVFDECYERETKNKAKFDYDEVNYICQMEAHEKTK